MNITFAPGIVWWNPGALYGCRILWGIQISHPKRTNRDHSCHIMENSISLARQEWSRFARFRWKIRIPHKILHRYSASGFHQTMPGAKVMSICMRFGSFLHFLSPEITYGVSLEPPKIMTKCPIDMIFFVNHIKNTRSLL